MKDAGIYSNIRHGDMSVCNITLHASICMLSNNSECLRRIWLCRPQKFDAL